MPHTESTAETAAESRTRIQAILLSLIVGVALLVAKFAAWALTGSTAILSDALESVVNVVAAAFAAYSVHLANQPADRNHPYGHGKVEDFSAGAEGMMIVVAAAAIAWAAVPRLFDPQPIGHLGAGIAVVVVAGAVNGALGLYLIRKGRETRSRAVEADGKHLLTDAYTSAALVVGLSLVAVTGELLLDPALACAMALNILVSGLRIVRESIARLMDEADPEVVQRILDQLWAHHAPGVLAPHHLRARRQGRLHHVDVHLVIPRFWTIEEAHRHEQELEEALFTGLGAPGEAVFHTDPCRPVCCSYCPLEGCPVRGEAFEVERHWTVESAVAGPPWAETDAGGTAPARAGADAPDPVPPG